MFLLFEYVSFFFFFLFWRFPHFFFFLSRNASIGKNTLIYGIDQKVNNNKRQIN